MRQKKYEITDQTEVEDILRQAQVLYLALNDTDAPYVLPLSYGYESGRIYFHCAPEGRKLDLLRADSKVGFTVSTDVALQCKGDAANPCSYTMHYKSVIGTGTARIVNDPEEKLHGLRLLMAQYAPGEWRFKQEKVDRTEVVCIAIETLSGKKIGS